MKRFELTAKFNKIRRQPAPKKPAQPIVLADDVHRVAMKTPNLYQSHSVPIVRKMEMRHS